MSPSVSQMVYKSITICEQEETLVIQNKSRRLKKFWVSREVKVSKMEFLSQQVKHLRSLMKLYVINSQALNAR